MVDGEHENEASDLIRRFLAAASQDQIDGSEDDWFTADAFEVVWPHRLLPEGRMRDLRAIGRSGASERINDLEVSNIVVARDIVVVEAAHNLEIGSETHGSVQSVRVNVAFVFTLRQRRICSIHAYRCEHF